MASAGLFGVLVISHGSRSADWVRLVDDAVAAVRLPDGVPVVAGFLELVNGRLIQDGIDALEAQGVTDIVVIPLFISSGSTHVHEIAWALGLLPACAFETDLTPFRVRARVAMTSPIDVDPIVAAMLWHNVRELSIAPERELVLLVAHGSSMPRFAAQWRAGLRRLASRVQELGGFAEGDFVTLLQERHADADGNSMEQAQAGNSEHDKEQGPAGESEEEPDAVRRHLAGWRKRRPDLAIIAVPLFVSEGYFTRDAIPARLAGLEYRYNGKTLLPNSLLSRWMERQVETWLQGMERGGAMLSIRTGEGECN